MRTIANQYYQNLFTIMNAIKVSDRKGDHLDFYDGIAKAGELLVSRAASGQKVMFIGNGASAAISSHMAADYSKNGGMPAIAFNDIALLTAVSNDLGYQHVFEKPLSMFAEEADILVAISSSGRSENILQGVRMARQKGCAVITLSGFAEENPLRALGDINFYVPCLKYGPVEVVHHSICHCILDVIMEKRKKIEDLKIEN